MRLLPKNESTNSAAYKCGKKYLFQAFKALDYTEKLLFQSLAFSQRILKALKLI